jgi:hypothetical protein
VSVACQVSKAIKVMQNACLAIQDTQEMGRPVKSAKKENTVNKQVRQFAHPAQRANFPNLVHLLAPVA